MNLFPAADNEIKTYVRDEAPEYSLGYGKCQGDEDYSQKRRQTLLDFAEINLADAFEHRGADENQHRRRRIRWNHARQGRQKEARQKAERRKNGRHARSSADVDAGDAF